jgi:UDP:flavonoid glycosyltransferase YjiC (YdhE family)
MKLVALTYGTEGDTRPVAALCRALMDAGDEVTLLADGGTLGSARDLGVPHGALAGDIRETLQSLVSPAVSGKNRLNANAQALARIVLPFAADQFFWAEQSRLRGIAVAAGSMWNVTTAALSRAIAAAQSTEMRERASTVGTKMRAEDGLAEAVGRVHALMAR